MILQNSYKNSSVFYVPKEECHYVGTNYIRYCEPHQHLSRLAELVNLLLFTNNI